MILKNLRVNSGYGDKTNCYILQDSKTKETMVVDPGGEAETILEMLDTLEANVKYIYITHCHGDHTEAVNQIKDKKGGKIVTYILEAENINNPNINMCSYMDIPEVNITIDSRVNDDDLIHVGDLELKVIHTPGHTSGGSSLYCETEGFVITGDTLFKSTWGRTDLPTGNFVTIMNTIVNKLLVLPDDTIVYPGHGHPTKIRDEEPMYYNLMPPEE